MPKPKILIALFRLPYPATDGTRYKILYNLAEGLLQEFDIEFFVVSIKKYSTHDLEYLEKHFGKVHLFHHSKLAYAVNALPAISNGLPLQAQGFAFADAQRWLDAHIDDYDAVYVHEIRMTELFIKYSDEQKKKFLMDFNDAISMNYRDGHSTMAFPRNLFFRWEGKRVAAYESKVLDSFVHFSIVSDADRRYLLGGKSGIDFSVIAHGAPLSEEIADLDRNEFFFMGSLDYAPNRDALEYFLKMIWPRVLEKMPDMRLIVLGGGRIPGGYASTPGVSWTGFVPSVFETVRHCKALVAPIRFAGGTPSKIVESMGYGFPVITTPQGSAGIAGIETGINSIIVPESDTERWVAAIERLVQDTAFAESMGKRARQLIVEGYSQDAAQEAFRERFRTIIEK